jgi:hypothetical protein
MSLIFIERFSEKLDEMIAAKIDTLTYYRAEDYATYTQWLGAIKALREAKQAMQHLIDDMSGKNQKQETEDGSDQDA